jgi:hypothetical protein
MKMKLGVTLEPAGMLLGFALPGFAGYGRKKPFRK